MNVFLSYVVNWFMEINTMQENKPEETETCVQFLLQIKT